MSPSRHEQKYSTVGSKKYSNNYILTEFKPIFKRKNFNFEPILEENNTNFNEIVGENETNRHFFQKYNERHENNLNSMNSAEKNHSFGEISPQLNSKLFSHFEFSKISPTRAHDFSSQEKESSKHFATFGQQLISSTYPTHKKAMTFHDFSKKLEKPNTLQQSITGEKEKMEDELKSATIRPFNHKNEFHVYLFIYLLILRFFRFL